MSIIFFFLNLIRQRELFFLINKKLYIFQDALKIEINNFFLKDEVSILQKFSESNNYDI